MERCVPASVPGIVFLSGGLSEEAASVYLNNMNTLYRKAYRGMLFTTEGLGKYISGAILFEETLYQYHQDGESMVKKLNDLGIIPGIKVDKGLNPLPGGGNVETF